MLAANDLGGDAEPLDERHGLGEPLHLGGGRLLLTSRAEPYCGTDTRYRREYGSRSRAPP